MNKRIALLAWLAIGMVGGTGTALAQQDRDKVREQAQDDDGAQTPQDVSRPFRGLFGAGSVGKPYGHALEVTAAVYNEFGNDPSDPLPVVDSVIGSQATWFSGVRTNVSFQKRGQFSDFGIQSEALTRYYQDLNAWTAVRSRTTVAAERTLGLRQQTRLRVGGSFERDPYYTLPLMPSAPPVIGEGGLLPTTRDDLLGRQDRYVTTGEIRLEQTIGRRNAVGFESAIRNSESDVDGFDVRDWQVAGYYSRRATRYLSIRLGYGYQRGEYGFNRSQLVIGQNIDVGLDYQRPLTRSRRTMVAFGTGSSIVTIGPDRQYRITGSANVHHQMGRGWSLTGGYERGVQPVEGFSGPFLFDTVTGTVGGLVGRRVELLASGGYSTGALGFDDGTYTLIQASARVRFAVTRHLALDVEGLTFRSQFPEDVIIASPVSLQYHRRAVRTNLTVWLPML